jgi:hypothetical protein
MSGSVLGEPGEIYLHPEEMAIHSTHAQINWLGYRSAQAETLVILNDGDRATVEIRFRTAAKGSAKILHTNDGKEWTSESSPSTSNLSIQIGVKACTIVVRYR